MPSTTTPTAGPWDSPNVVMRNSCPNVEDIGAGLLLPAPRGARALLLRALERGVDPLPVRLVRIGEPLELIEIRRPDVAPRLGDPRLAALPRHDVLAGVVEEHLLV